jgi:hypothetical protein
MAPPPMDLPPSSTMPPPHHLELVGRGAEKLHPSGLTEFN